MLSVIARHSRAFILLAAIAALLGLSSLPRTHAGTPTGFVSEPVLVGLEQATDFEIAPDGRVFVAARTGEVLVYKDGALLDTFVELPDVNSAYFRGLLGLALDPQFASNGYVYVYYVYENNPAAPQAPKTSRVVRFTAAGNQAVPGSAYVVIGSDGGNAAQPRCSDLPAGADCIPADSVDHFGGGLRFAPDGTLFLSTGDAIINPLLVQDLDFLAGKLLHINPDGTAAGGNPFHTGDASANRSKVWAYGFRNPFRLGVEPATGMPVVGDVGAFWWEELNAIEPGGNYGWPCYEGAAPQANYGPTPFCTAFYQSNTPTEHPAYMYPNAFRQGGSAIAAGVFNNGTLYPEEYEGAFIFADFMQGWIKALPLDGDPTVEPETLLTNVGNPVAFDVGPDGYVYYLTLGALTGIGDLSRIVYQPGNRPPVAKASATPNGGLAPLDVSFSSAGSDDPDGDQLTYYWEFGDGATSDEPNPIYTYALAGTYSASLSVTDDEGAEATRSLTIVAGNEPPQAFIDSPPSGTAYQPGESIRLSGHGMDPVNGRIGGPWLQWTAILYHCEPSSGGCHSHQFQYGRNDVFTIMAPDQTYDLYYLEAVLTATDWDGLTGSTSIMLGPDTDGDGLLDQDELFSAGTDRLNSDTDGDGCNDGAELGGDAFYGGRRDPLDPWDFFDTPSQWLGWRRDGRVDFLNDVFDVAMRYGTTGVVPAGEEERLQAAMAPPTTTSGYHPAFDRSQPAQGDEPWKLGPPNGTIDLFTDIFGVAKQFGHHCD